MMFADLAGFSRLHDAYAPLFQRRFLEIVAHEIDAAPIKPLDSKTWGDGLYIVFESPVDGAEFALRLQASMQAVDWKTAGLSETSGIRIALHAGPVFREPWEAQAFALAVRLSETGRFSWREWTTALSQEIQGAPDRSRPRFTRSSTVSPACAVARHTSSIFLSH